MRSIFVLLLTGVFATLYGQDIQLDSIVYSDIESSEVTYRFSF